MAEALDSITRQQGMMYALLAPLAMLAIAVWLVDGQWLRVLVTAFAVYSAALNWLLPSTGRVAVKTALSAALGILVASTAGLMAWYSDGLSLLLCALAAMLLLRLWYLRQYHLQQGRQDRAELLRRCLLISLWSHISVLAAWINPY